MNLKKMKQKTNKGITLIALVITIVVMLILVAVTISMAVNGGLFSYAGKAAQDTNNAYASEQNLGSGAVTVDGKEYENIDYYLAGIAKGALPENWTLAKTLPTEYNWDTNKVAPITDGTNYVPLPKNYSVVEINGKAEVEEGLVIKDSNNNEFVWIPVPKTEPLLNPYSWETNYLEPKLLESDYIVSGKKVGPYDSQDVLTELYGYKEDGKTPYFSYANDFKYAEEYAEMVASVKKYYGFYIGRYETTIDGSGNIGSVYGTNVLSTEMTIKSGTNPKNSESYFYRWYGLYYVSKTTSYIVGNGTNVQSAMIYGQLYDKAIAYIKANDTEYTVDTSTSSWHTSSGVKKSGKANEKDVALNIYDLESNTFELTQEANFTYYRTERGGHSWSDRPASGRYYSHPYQHTWAGGTRLALYIK